MKTRLKEGLRSGDLRDLILPLISVEEYESRVDPDKAIVFGCYVHDKDAANDLNRFVQKSALPILDTEVSPAPDQHGFYLVFIELLDNERLGKTVDDLLKEIAPLADIHDWTLRVRKTKELLAFTPEVLRQALDHAKKSTAQTRDLK